MAVAEIEISEEKILHQVKLRAYVSGEAAKEGEASRLATQSQPGDDNDDVLGAFIANGHSRLVDALSGVLEKGCRFYGDFIDDCECDCNCECESEAEEDPSLCKCTCGCRGRKYTYTLDVPYTFDGNQLQGIRSGIAEYLVNYVLYEWYRMVWPEKTRLYTDNMEDELRAIGRRANRRTSPVRRKCNPF